MAAKRTITTIREQVYRILRDDICQGVYAPGTRLQEVELAENLNVSRSPVREAIRQLAADGLLLEIPNKGVYVKEFTVKDIEEIYDLRVMLESYGILHSDGHITSMRRERLLGLLSDMESFLQKGDLQSYTAADEKLHSHIVHLGDNSLINDTYDRVRSMNQQFRILSLMDEQRFRESMDEHREIIHALVTGNLKRADDINRHHLELARKAILKRMKTKEPE
jgi:DNA-binding GntR family transcriptional regulator